MRNPTVVPEEKVTLGENRPERPKRKIFDERKIEFAARRMEIFMIGFASHE